jgi:imidazolonepropionase-like amidohydrolase
MERIEADLLIPGRGDPIRDATLLLDHDRIAYAGPAADAPPTERWPDATVTRAATVLPGLWDAHTHLLGLHTLDFSQLFSTDAAVRAARCTHSLRAALDAGVTSVREVGGLGVHLARVVDEGLIEGPAIYGAGSVISTTGGHGDVHPMPLPWVADYAHQGGEIRLADGPAECAKAVREQLRRNAKVIKICASGGVLSEIDDPIHQQFTAAELRAIVEVAGLADRIVAAHCHGKPGMMAAIEAGVRTIEHGTYLDDEVCAAMRETGTILVTTRTLVREMVESAAAPPYAMKKLELMADLHAEAMARAHAAGVRLVAGTDLATSTGGGSWGRNGRELPLLEEIGMTPLQAIEAATAAAPETLGPQAPRSGRLAEGYDADVIMVDGDPLVDLKLLADPTRILGVWRGGRRVKY